MIERFVGYISYWKGWQRSGTRSGVTISVRQIKTPRGALRPGENIDKDAWTIFGFITGNLVPGHGWRGSVNEAVAPDSTTLPWANFRSYFFYPVSRKSTSQMIEKFCLNLECGYECIEIFYKNLNFVIFKGEKGKSKFVKKDLTGSSYLSPRKAHRIV